MEPSQSRRKWPDADVNEIVTIPSFSAVRSRQGGNEISNRRGFTNNFSDADIFYITNNIAKDIYESHGQFLDERGIVDLFLHVEVLVGVLGSWRNSELDVYDWWQVREVQFKCIEQDVRGNFSS